MVELSRQCRGADGFAAESARRVSCAVPTRRLAVRRTGPCLTRRCPTSLSMKFAATCSSKRCWGRIAFARGLKPEPACSRRRGHSDGRPDVQIVPDTFYLLTRRRGSHSRVWMMLRAAPADGASSPLLLRSRLDGHCLVEPRVAGCQGDQYGTGVPCCASCVGLQQVAWPKKLMPSGGRAWCITARLNLA